MKIETQRLIDRLVGTIICRIFSIYYKIFKKAPHPRGTNRILIILLSEMGALVLGYPMLQRLKQKFPTASLHILLFEKNREVVELLDIIPSENIISINDSSMPVFAKTALAALARLRQLNIDTVIDCELFSRISSILSFLSGAAIRVGFHAHTQEGLYRGNFMNRPVLYNPYQHISRQFLTLVEAIDSDTEPVAKKLISKEKLKIPAMKFEPDEIEDAKQRLLAKAPGINGRKIVLIYPGGGLLPIRAWPLSHYCTLAEKLLERGYAVCIIGLAEDKSVAGRILSHTQSEYCVDLTGYTKTIRELMRIFQFSSLLITNDGGPGHFAAMTPLPTIIFYGPETPLLYGPIDEKAQNLFLGISCSPCVTAYNHRNSPCDGDNLCLKMIEPQKVLASALEILEP
ncbi:MAG: glycosyltransferase family 9 protein [Deltaproteobacteria bacterium]|nr:glycosyltransferase family 9 protein [Deltaproteobacteria bacterium]